MKKVFLSDKYRPIFEKEGFKKEFEEAKSKVEAFITKKEEALNLFKELNQTVTFARQEYEKFAQEVPNYLDKSRSR